MASKTFQISVLVVLVALLAVGAGCKKKQEAPSEPNAATEPNTAMGAPATVAAIAAIAQTTCPVMGGKIDENVYTEYDGQKVYFCCPGCIEKFKAEPEKYLAKLPQFVTLDGVGPA